VCAGGGAFFPPKAVCLLNRNRNIFKTCIFDRPTLSSTKWTRHFLQYARRTHACISSNWRACMNEPASIRHLSARALCASSLPVKSTVCILNLVYFLLHSCVYHGVCTHVHIFQVSSKFSSVYTAKNQKNITAYQYFRSV
jgi:hypothetical protein